MLGKYRIMIKHVTKLNVQQVKHLFNEVTSLYESVCSFVQPVLTERQI